MDLTIAPDGSLQSSSDQWLPTGLFPGTANTNDINLPYGVQWSGGIMACWFSCYNLEKGGDDFELMDEQMVEPRENPAMLEMAEGVLLVLGGRKGRESLSCINSLSLTYSIL